MIPETNESPVKPGDMLAGKYRVERLLGMGNMGVVVAATHIALKQRVALKFMLPTKAAGQEQHARFLREAQAAVRLKTQHVARVSDVGTLDSGAPYMVMELLDGRDIAAVLQERGPLPVYEAVDYILQACEAVAEAHASNIVHRDIKPANLFLTRGLDGKPCVKVLDFGISKHGDEVKLTQEEAVLGSPLYMSPEQIRSSGTVDARTDVWALGVVLYELVAGRTPFHAERILELVTKVNFEPPTRLSALRPDAPPGFAGVLMQCLEKDRERRMPSVAAFAAAIAPFGSQPHATIYAERVAAVLGEQIAPARPTAVLVPAATAPVEPSAPLVSATANALTRSSMSAPSRPVRGWTLAVGALALGVVAVGGFWAGRGRGIAAPSVGGPGEASASVSPVAPASVPPAASSPPILPLPPPASEPSGAPSVSAMIAPEPSPSAAKTGPPNRPARTKPTSRAAPPSAASTRQPVLYEQ